MDISKIYCNEEYVEIWKNILKIDDDLCYYDYKNKMLEIM